MSTTALGPLSDRAPRRELHHGWQLAAASGPAPAPIAAATVPATVPGCVHTDLLAAGLIPDPYLDDNESALAWIGLVDWTYRTTFAWAAGRQRARTTSSSTGSTPSRASTLNGRRVGETANQHRTYRFDVREHLRRRARTSSSSPSRRRSSTRTRRASRSGCGRDPTPSRTTRSASPRAASAGTGASRPTPSGIWRPVRLESWSTARLAEVRVRPIVDERRSSRSNVDVELERAGVSTRPRRRRHRRGGGCRGIHRRRRHLCDAARRRTRRGALVARGLRRAAPLRRARCTVGGVRRARRRARDASASASVTLGHDGGCRGHPVHARRQRPADLREGRELDPRRRASRCASTAPATSAGCGRPSMRTSTSSACGAAASTRATTSTSSATSSGC